MTLVLLLAGSAFGQSKSFEALKEHFDGEDDVHSFGVSGFLCRAALGMAGEWEFKKAIQEIKHLRFIVIPTEAFQAHQLTTTGFKKFLRQDGFEELSNIRDRGEEVTVYLQSNRNKKDIYFVLVEESDEVVAIEMKGYLDPNMLMDRKGIAKM